MVGIQVLPETIKLLISQNTAFDSVVKIYLAKNIENTPWQKETLWKESGKTFLKEERVSAGRFFCENFAQTLYRHYTDIILKAQALSESRFKNLPDLKENSYCRFAKWSEICCTMLLLNLKRLWRYKSNLLKSMYDVNGMWQVSLALDRWGEVWYDKCVRWGAFLLS